MFAASIQFTVHQCPDALLRAPEPAAAYRVRPRITNSQGSSCLKCANKSSGAPNRHAWTRNTAKGEPRLQPGVLKGSRVLGRGGHQLHVPNVLLCQLFPTCSRGRDLLSRSRPSCVWVRPRTSLSNVSSSNASPAQVATSSRLARSGISATPSATLPPAPMRGEVHTN